MGCNILTHNAFPHSGHGLLGIVAVILGAIICDLDEKICVYGRLIVNKENYMGLKSRKELHFTLWKN